MRTRDHIADTLNSNPRNQEAIISLFASDASLAVRVASSPSIAGQRGVDFLDPSAVQAAVMGLCRNMRP